MGYEIMYNKISLRTKRGNIVLLQTGSNNCFETNGAPEKNWSLLSEFNIDNKQMFFNDDKECLMYFVENQFFPGEEITQTGWELGLYKSRNTTFKNLREFSKFVSNSLNQFNNFTVEEFRNLGNCIEVLEMKKNEYKVENSWYVNTEEELLKKVDEIEERGNRVTMNLPRDLRKPKRETNSNKKSRALRLMEAKKVYVLKGKDSGYYFVKKTKRGSMLGPYVTSARQFFTRKEAEKYQEKYSLNQYEVVEYNKEK